MIANALLAQPRWLVNPWEKRIVRDAVVQGSEAVGAPKPFPE